jgi:hypothetical protein
MAVQVLALALIVQQPVAVAEIDLLSHSVHGISACGKTGIEVPF